MKCINNREIQVLKANKYYLGTVDEDGPYCRISEEYFNTKEQAETALVNKTFTERCCAENSFCSGCQHCGLR